MTLTLLGIIGIFKQLPNRRLIFVVSLIILASGIVFMVRIPLPTGFSIGSYL